MSVLFRGRTEEARALYQEVWARGGDVSTGVQGFSFVPLFAAWRFIAEQFASTPLHAYTETTSGDIRSAKQPRLFIEPEPNVTPFAWKSTAVLSALSSGNAIGYVMGETPSGWPSQIRWLDPNRVTIEDDAMLPEAYWFDGRRLDNHRVIHVPWVVPPGKRKGLSPLAAFKATFDAGAAAQTMMRDWYKNGGFPSAHMRSTNAVTAAQAEETKASTKAAIAGRDILVTGMDWTFEPISMPADEARFVEALRLTATQVASIYGVPPEKIGGERGGSTLKYTTVLMDQLAVQVETMRPWFTRFEEVFSLRCLPPPEVARFNLDAHLRADPFARAQTHEVNLRAGMETEAEGRRLENRPPMSDVERVAWLAAWRGAGGESKAESAARVLQQVYLAVGTVISAEEAREIVNEIGGTDLPSTLPESLRPEGSEQ